MTRNTWRTKSRGTRAWSRSLIDRSPAASADRTISSGPGWGVWLESAMGSGHRLQHAGDLLGGGLRVMQGADPLGPGPVAGAVIGGDVVADRGVAAGHRQARPAAGAVG